ncbi:MAG: hypothetical protein ACRCVN_06445 [Spirochaetia bacterium]
MNTTSSIFKEPAIYTVVDHCTPKENEDSLTIAILPRGEEPFFSPLIEELIKVNPQELILFNTNFDVPKGINQVRHVWIKEEVSAGEMVNVAIREAHSKFVFILWSNQEFSSQEVSSQVFWRIEERDDLCTIAQLYDRNHNSLPVQSIPAFDRVGFRVIRTLSDRKDARVFSPFDYSGIYNRTRFLNLGGYDTSIENPYWQKNDFSMRAAMWDERIVLNTALSLYYTSEPPVENEDFDLSSRIFALKCLGIKHKRKGATLPIVRWLWVSKLPHSWVLFKEIRTWVHENRFRFRFNVEQIIDNWHSF